MATEAKLARFRKQMARLEAHKAEMAKPAADRQADVLGLDGLAPATQEVRELVAAALTVLASIGLGLLAGHIG